MADIYRVIYRAQYCDHNKLESTIDFKKRMDENLPVPEIKEITLAGVKSIPVKLSYKEEGDTKLFALNGTELNLKIKAGEYFDLKSFYVTDETEIMVVMYGHRTWNGFIIPDNCSEPFLAGTYDVQIRATDRIGVLKTIPYRDLNKPIKGMASDAEVLTRALNYTGLNMGLLSAVNTFEITMNKGLADDPLAQTYIDQSAFIDENGDSFSCYDVIKSILSRWYAELSQHNGVWQIVAISEKQNGLIPARFIPPYQGVTYTVLGDTVNAGGEGRSIRPTGSSYLAPALKSALAYYRYGYPSNKLINGDFQNWPVVQVIPPGWKIEQAGSTGNIEVARGVSNADPTDFYAIIRGSGSGWLMNAEPVQVRQNEIVGVTFDMFAPTAYSPAGGNRYLSIVVRNEFGKYFTTQGWRDSFQFYDVVYRSQDLRNQQSVRFDIGDFGSDYKLEIGVTLIRTSGGAGGNRYETNINNFNVRPSNVSNQVKPALGMFTENTLVSDQTKKIDPILLLHGDELNNQRTSRIFINNIPPVNELKWTRRGFVEEVKLLTTVANSALMVHQRPYNIFEFESNGDGDIDINSLLIVDLMDGQYSFMSGYFDLMGGHHRLRFVESISNHLNENDIYGYEQFTEDYGGVKDKDGVSVSTPGGVGTGMGGTPVPGTLDPNGFVKNQSDYQDLAEFNVLRGNFQEKAVAPEFHGALKGTADNSNYWKGYTHWFEEGAKDIQPASMVGYGGGFFMYLYSSKGVRDFVNDTLQTVLEKGNTSTLGAKFGGAVSWGNGAYEYGVSKVYNDSSYGTVMTTKKGSLYDFIIMNSNGSAVFSVPTSTLNMMLWADIYSSNYVSGAVGAGFKIDHSGNAEFDSITIRKTLNVTELNIREITGTGGSFAVTNTLLVNEAVDGGTAWGLHLNTDEGHIYNQLKNGDIIRCQVWDGSGLKYYTGVVSVATSSYILINKSSMSGAGIPAKGDKLFQFGNTTDLDRQGLIYMTNSDVGAPYLDILDGVNSADLTGKTKVRLGKLNGINSNVWGMLSGYGLYGQNAYLENGSFSGVINVTGGNAATNESVQNKVNISKIDGGQIYRNPLYVDGNSGSSLILNTRMPATACFYMCSVVIKGYRYGSQKNNDIDLTVSFYSAGDFYGYSIVNSGSYIIDKVRLAKNTSGNFVSIILGENNQQWGIVRLVVESAMITGSVINDIYYNDWSYIFSDDFSTLTDITGYLPSTISESVEGSESKSSAAQEAAEVYAANRVDTLQGALGSLAWDDVVEKAKLGTTVIEGGYILTSLLRADEIQAAVVTSVYINTLALDAATIQTGKLSAERIDVDSLVVKNLKTFDTGRRLEITGAANSLVFYGISEQDDTVYKALEISDYIDAGNFTNYAVAGLRTTTPDGYSSYVTGNGVYSNGGGVRFLDAAALNTNASIAATLTQRNTSTSGVSAAVAGIDATSDSTPGSSTTYAAYFRGRTMLGGAIQTRDGSGNTKGGATGTFRWFAYVGANQVVWEYEFVNGILTGARVV